MPVPRRSKCITARGNEIFIGTRYLGISRLRLGRGRPRRSWLRQGALIGGGLLFTVACAGGKDCYITTGAPNAWRYNGGNFTKEEVPGSQALAFVRDDKGKIYALSRSEDERRVDVYRRRRGKWKRVSRVAIEVPGRTPDLSFARFSPSGKLWVGLTYENDEGDAGQPYGAAVVDIGSRDVTYHRSDPGDGDSQGWPIPVGLNDVAFLSSDEIWFSSLQGAAQVVKDEVRRHNASNGLQNDVLRGLTISGGGLVFAATSGGIATYNGENWSFPDPLRRATNDVETGPDGRLWMATDRGVAVYDGSSVHRLDVHRGLVENQIKAITLDHLGRIWARSGKGITLITP